MDVQLGRTIRRDPRRLTADGVTGIFAALGFAFAALWPVVGPELRGLEAAFREIAPSPSHRTPRAPRAHATGPGAVTAPSEREPAPETARLRPVEPPAPAHNVPPVIETVRVRGGSELTAGSDVRLDVAAADENGDGLELRVRWTVNDRQLETRSARLPRSEIRRGDQVSAVVVAHDGYAASDPFRTPVFRVGNALPVITTFPGGFDASGAFVYPIGAIDPDGDRELVYRLVEGPRGMSIEPQDGTVRWTPGSDQAGRHAVRVEVRDGRGGLDRQSFELHVRRSPRKASSLADRGVGP